MTAKIKPTKPRRMWADPVQLSTPGYVDCIAPGQQTNKDVPVVLLATDPASVKAMVERAAKAIQATIEAHKFSSLEIARACVAALHPSLKRK